jgi:hypothetical protein
MDPILQTLTLAIILLIAGIICMVIGVVGLVWKTDTTGGGWKKSIFRQSWGKRRLFSPTTTQSPRRAFHLISASRPHKSTNELVTERQLRYQVVWTWTGVLPSQR